MCIRLINIVNINQTNNQQININQMNINLMNTNDMNSNQINYDQMNNNQMNEMKINDMIDKAAYKNMQSNSDKEFYDKIMHTQMFDELITKRMLPKDKR